MPTMLDLAGVPVPVGHKLDGISLAPLLLKGEALPSRTLFWGYGGRYAVRQGPWKLVVNQPGAGSAKGKKAGTVASTELYDLANDIGEQHDLASRERSRVRQLEAALAAWQKDVGGQ
jgi:arylsulfatase A-like enzyme